jgi:response regulator RpfG family c-di-GMP phosphodiesterase
MVRILLTGYTDVEALVEAINCGLVYMYISKPWNNDELKLKVGRAREHYESNKKQHSLTLANDRLQQRLKDIEMMAHASPEDVDDSQLLMTSLPDPPALSRDNV